MSEIQTEGLLDQMLNHHDANGDKHFDDGNQETTMTEEDKKFLNAQVNTALVFVFKKS